MALDATKDYGAKVAVPGVYSITCKTTAGRYIGSTRDFKKRKSAHLSELRNGRHKNRRLQADWNLYGEEAFSVDLLFVCEREALIWNEQRAMNVFQPSYNLAPMAGTQLGVKLSDETKRRMSEVRINPSEETRAKLSAAHTGIKHTPEAIARMRAAKANVSQETREKMSAARPKCKKVVCNGVVYESARKAALAIGIKYTTLGAMLRGQNANRFNAKYVI